jgi:hypothetical protein
VEINGKKVVDATRKVKIFINKHDTVVGDNKNPSSCAAARAVKRDVTDCLSARVHIGRVYVEQKDKWVRYFTPEALRTEIIAFDRGGTFAPGTYELKPPSPAESTRARKEYRTGRTSSSSSNPRSKLKIAKIKRHNVTGIRPGGANR